MELVRRVTLGQYVDRPSPLHRLDPRVKLIGLCLLMALVFQLHGGSSFAILLFLLLVAAASSQVGLSYFLGGLLSIFWLATFTALFNLLLTREGQVVWSFHFLAITNVGLFNTALMLGRILTLVVGTTLLTLTTAPVALTDGLERLGAPLARVGLPVHDMAMMVSISLRFIPTLMEQAERLIKAQMARGADVESRYPWRRVRALIPVVVPLFVGAFRAADDLADAMEARGYRGGPRQRAYRQLAWRRRDTIATLLLCGAGVALWQWDRWWL